MNETERERLEGKLRIYERALTELLAEKVELDAKYDAEIAGTMSEIAKLRAELGLDSRLRGNDGKAA